MSLLYRIKQHPSELTLILSICVLIATIVVLSSVPSSRFNESNAQPIDEVKALNNSKEELAIKKATEHFMDTIHIVHPSDRIFLTYVQRKFSLDPKLGPDQVPIDLYENPRTYPEHLHFLARIAYPNRIVKVAPNMQEMDDDVKFMNIYSINCDRMDLPTNFWGMMDKNTKEGGYYTAHTILALAFMKDNGCTLPTEANDLKEQAIEALVKIAGDSTVSPDLRYEVTAFLLMDNRHDLVKQEWIDQIIAEQRPDGSWIHEFGDSKDDPHTTLLALWSLLEYARPNTPDEPLIHRPTSQ